MKKTLVLSSILTLFTCSSLIAQICFNLSNNENTLTLSVSATDNYSTPPNSIWTVSNIVLSWPSSLGTSIITSSNGLNGFPYSTDGPPQVEGSTVYQKFGYSGQSYNFPISAGSSTDVLQITVMHDTEATGSFTLSEAPPIINGDAAFLNVFANQFASGTCNLSVNDVPLPLELINFTAKKENEDVLLTWITSFEQNIDYYEIQKSKDGRNWIKVDEEEAYGNDLQEITYEVKDKNAFEDRAIERLYYRLKIYELDGLFSFSNVREVISKDQNSISIYPNPTSDVINFGIEAKQYSKVCISLFDKTGKKIFENNKNNIVAGYNSLRLSTDSLVSGIYIVKVIIGTKVFTDKLTVIK